MIGTIVRVVRSEGAGSAMRRAGERVEEAAKRVRGWLDRRRAPLLNVAVGGLTPRNGGGIAVQLAARLREERAFRGIEATEDFDRAARDGRPLHLEGTYGLPLDRVLHLLDNKLPVVLGVHDLSLFDEPPELARVVLTAARGTIFPSAFLLQQHRERFAIELAEAAIVEPSGPVRERRDGARLPDRVAFAGAVQRHKGGYFLPEIASALAARGMTLHVFGGGDAELLHALRRHANVVIYGYYRSGTLPSLLARHRIGLVLLPSIVPESYGLTLSESWNGGAAAAAFDLGAVGERIRHECGGLLAPPDSGAAGLIALVDRWRAEGASLQAPRVAASPAIAARAYLELYRRWGLLS